MQTFFFWGGDLFIMMWNQLVRFSGFQTFYRFNKNQRSFTNFKIVFFSENSFSYTMCQLFKGNICNNRTKTNVFSLWIKNLTGYSFKIPEVLWKVNINLYTPLSSALTRLIIIVDIPPRSSSSALYKFINVVLAF